MERRLFPKSCFAFLVLSTLCSSTQILAEDLESAAVEVSETLTSVHSELETLGGDACPKCDCTRSACCCGHYVDWTKVPGSIRPLPRPGNCAFLRTGPGYHSVRRRSVRVFVGR